VPGYTVGLGSSENAIEELVALIGDYAVARAAFEKAVKRRLD
jgi:hypothetical protein